MNGSNIIFISKNKLLLKDNLEFFIDLNYNDNKMKSNVVYVLIFIIIMV